MTAGYIPEPAPEAKALMRRKAPPLTKVPPSPAQVAAAQVAAAPVAPAQRRPLPKPPHPRPYDGADWESAQAEAGYPIGYPGNQRMSQAAAGYPMVPVATVAAADVSN